MNVIVLGLPGSGKSYFAKKLAQMIPAIYINSDRLRKELFPKRTYSADEKTKVYNTMLKKMMEANADKKNFVLDATFHKKETRKLFKEAIGSKLFFIEVYAEEDIIRERVKKSRPYSEADFEIYKLIAQQWEPLEEPHLKLKSTNNNIDQMLQKAKEYLNN